MNRVWQLPQNIVGRIVLKISKARYVRPYKTAQVYAWNRKDGVSLGGYIFVPHSADTEYIKHEYGHSLQSKSLGWLYLPVISLPSLIWAGCFNNYRKKHNVSYYSFYTERWADKLGEVNRDDNT